MTEARGLLGSLKGMVVAAAMALAGCGGADRESPAPPPRDTRTGASPEVRLEPEAGFVEVGLGGVTTAPVANRLFYSFFPAESHPEDAPVLVFFNGGPGSATTSLLWLYGTAPYVVDPDADSAEEERPRENPFPYTRLGNLLYIDARSTGFSYSRFGSDPPASPAAVTPDVSLCRDGDSAVFRAAACMAGEAVDFIETLLEFLDTHRTLTNNPVVLVGESYGGNRAMIMLSMLQHYADPLATARVPDYGCLM